MNPADLSTCVARAVDFNSELRLPSTPLALRGQQASQSSQSAKCLWPPFIAGKPRKKKHQTLTWLRCDKDEHSKYVERLWCESCRRFEDRIRGVKNFSVAWISGSTNQKLSNAVDHARSDHCGCLWSALSNIKPWTDRLQLTPQLPRAC